MKTRKKNNAGNVRKVFAQLTVKDLMLIKGGDGPATSRNEGID